MLVAEQWMDDVATYLGLPPEKVINSWSVRGYHGSMTQNLCRRVAGYIHVFVIIVRFVIPYLGSRSELLLRWRCNSIWSGVAAVPYPEVLD